MTGGFMIAGLTAFRRVNPKQPDAGFFAVPSDADRVSVHNANQGDGEEIAGANGRRRRAVVLRQPSHHHAQTEPDRSRCNYRADARPISAEPSESS